MEDQSWFPYADTKVDDKDAEIARLTAEVSKHKDNYHDFRRLAKSQATEIAQLTRRLRILAWQLSYGRDIEPHEISIWADGYLYMTERVLGNIDAPEYRDLKAYVEQEAKDGHSTDIG